MIGRRGGRRELDAAGYAEAVVEVLARHFPGVAANRVTAEIIAKAVEHQVGDPRESFEVIVDDPRSANWRLKGRREDRRQVRLACYRMNHRDEDAGFERTVNDALAALQP